MTLSVHAMIDTETLGINSKAPITQIGVVVFNEEGIIDELDIALNFEEAFKIGRLDASTIKWWIMQGAEAKAKAMEGKYTPHFAAAEVIAFIEKNKVEFFWAHATFDFPIVNNWFSSLRFKTPIDFRSCRDMRTIEHFFGDQIAWEPRQGTHHSAVDDARFQAVHCIKMLKVAKQLGKVEV